MRRGIHLGPRTSRWLRLVWSLAAVGLVSVLAHAALYARERSALAKLRQQALEAVDADDRGRWSDSEALALEQLHAVLVAGAPLAIAPTELLALVSSSLPPQVSVVSATGDLAGPSPSLVIEAVASSDEDISSLSERISAASRVVRTRVLEERRLPEGGSSVRLHVDLRAEPGT